MDLEAELDQLLAAVEREQTTLLGLPSSGPTLSGSLPTPSPTLMHAAGVVAPLAAAMPAASVILPGSMSTAMSKVIPPSSSMWVRAVDEAVPFVAALGDPDVLMGPGTSGTAVAPSVQAASQPTATKPKRNRNPNRVNRRIVPCSHCKQRRKKCDTARPACARCAKMGLVCEYALPASASSSSQASRHRTTGHDPSRVRERRDSSVSSVSSSLYASSVYSYSDGSVPSAVASPDSDLDAVAQNHHMDDFSNAVADSLASTHLDLHPLSAIAPTDPYLLPRSASTQSQFDLSLVDFSALIQPPPASSDFESNSVHSNDALNTPNSTSSNNSTCTLDSPSPVGFTLLPQSPFKQPQPLFMHQQLYSHQSQHKLQTQSTPPPSAQALQLLDAFKLSSSSANSLPFSSIDDIINTPIDQLFPSSISSATSPGSLLDPPPGSCAVIISPSHVPTNPVSAPVDTSRAAAASAAVTAATVSMLLDSLPIARKLPDPCEGCRQWRKKCDRAVPNCSQCIKRGLVCRPSGNGGQDVGKSVEEVVAAAAAAAASAEVTSNPTSASDAALVGLELVAGNVGDFKVPSYLQPEVAKIGTYFFHQQLQMKQQTDLQSQEQGNESKCMDTNSVLPEDTMRDEEDLQFDNDATLKRKTSPPIKLEHESDTFMVSGQAGGDDDGGSTLTRRTFRPSKDHEGYLNQGHLLAEMKSLGVVPPPLPAGFISASANAPAVRGAAILTSVSQAAFSPRTNGTEGVGSETFEFPSIVMPN
ncbi:hypothetical protein BC830DRAFT_473085 [Chytriomyces sp. MP71]|nr:hypothetical protein BC830DRAFT_473085 [Chytriomyces sp. MP71]